MNIKRCLNWFGVLIAMLVVHSCSKDGDDLYDLGEKYDYYNSTNDYMLNELSGMNVYFHGVWSVDEETANETDVAIVAKDGKYFINIYGFPYEAITKKVVPDVNVSKIQYLVEDGIHLSPADSVLINIYMQWGTNDYATFPGKDFQNQFRNVGFSGLVLYLELMPVSWSPYLYLPYVAITDKGENIGISAAFAFISSTATLDFNKNTFVCVLKIPEIEIIRNNERKMLSKEMKLQFTSIKRIDKSSVGN